MALPSHAAPVTVAGYTYDFSQGDVAGGTTSFHGAPLAQDPTNTKLTDGQVGTLDKVAFGIQQLAFPNGTWTGFVNNGFGNAFQPRVIFDLGGTFNVDTVEVSYLVEDEASIYAPQEVTAVDPETQQTLTVENALTAQTSADGVAFNEAAFTNAFTPVFGPGGDAGTGVLEQRTSTLALGGVSASHVAIEIHTPYSFIFLGEVSISASEAGIAGDYNGSGQVEQGDLDLVLLNWGQDGATPPAGWTNDLPTGLIDQAELDGVLLNWGGTSEPNLSGASVPEPATLGVLGLGMLGLFSARRRRGAAA